MTNDFDVLTDMPCGIFEESEDRMDEELRRRLESTLQTVQRWDADPNLLRHCRQRIFSPSVRPFLGEDGISSRDFMQQFVRYFKDHIMIWCNKPSCTSCGKNGDNMEGMGSRAPVSFAEQQGEASRVEVYRCSICRAETTFPRYNNVQTLYEISCNGDAKTPGRCGEYANLFGFYCQALGLETRYILDWTDHVWVEVLLRLSTDEVEQWCMIDSCEGVLNECSMYERGWGKDLNYIVAISTTAITDVTCKYTRKLREPSFQQRRRAITTSEDNSRRFIQQMNQSLLSSLSTREGKLVQELWQQEDKQLKQVSKMSSWGSDQHYQFGRLSGSIQWKALRNETGNRDSSLRNGAGGSFPNSALHLPQWFYVGTPYNTTYDCGSGNDFEIYLRPPPLHLSDHEYCHDMIQVNCVPCAIGCRNALSLVVLDERFDTGMGGCILQSNSFTTIREFLDFVSSVPSQRILVVAGSIPAHSEDDWITSAERDALSLELGELFCVDHIPVGILYIGQVHVSEQPSWSKCCSYFSAPGGIKVFTAKNADKANGNCRTDAKLQSPELKLCTIPNVRPRKICGRVSDVILPLSTQCEAGYEAKRAAFLSYMATNPHAPCFGYTTKSGMPIYLLGMSSYPLIESSRDMDDDLNAQDNWNTFLLLPSILVPEEDNGIADCAMENTEASLSLPSHEIPLDQTFFQNELGAQLLFDGNCRLPTSDALRNTRLVAYYFSAHWCGRMFLSSCHVFHHQLCLRLFFFETDFPLSL
jgi:peptide-N4-(N-acetyl-beta-glucosaminyl)asparagine amidase